MPLNLPGPGPLVPFKRRDETAAGGANVTINVDVAGAITWTGQQVGLVTSVAATPGAIQWAGQQVGLTTRITPTVGAITWTGQTVGLTTAIVTGAGAITWAGQSVGLKTSIATGAGAITWAGQQSGLVTRITPTVGNITWQGATDITLVTTGPVIINVDVAGNITWTGQSVGLKTNVTPTAGAIQWQGQGVGLLTSIATAAGAITWNGQQLGLKTTITPTVGAITWAGQQTGLKTSIAVVGGAITWNGQQVGLVLRITPTAGNITWQGATDIVLQITGGTIITVDVPGAITWAGQAVGLRTSIALVGGAITWNGQQVGLLKAIPVVGGAITWAGQNVGLRGQIGVVAGNVTWQGQMIFLLVPGAGGPVKGPVRKRVLVGPTSVDDLAGPPRKVPLLVSGPTLTVLSGLVGWWDFGLAANLYQDTALTVPITADGQTIAAARDLSGGGHHMLQASASSRPIWKTGIIGAFSIARFDGSDDGLQASAFMSNQPSVSLFGIFRRSSTATPGPMAEWTQPAFYGVHFWNFNTGSEIFANFRTDADVTVSSSPGSVVANTPYRAGLVAGSGIGRIYLNGAQVGGDVTVPGDGQLRVGFPLLLGQRQQAGATFWSGDQGEVLVWNRALTALEITAVDTYLNTRWSGLGVPAGSGKIHELVGAPRAVLVGSAPTMEDL